jgi:hypothetical protein
MPNIKKVSDIKSALLRPALTSNFEVKIAIPAELQSFVGTEQNNLNLRCSEASLPGSQIATMENLNDHTGVTERLAHRRMFDDRINFTFYVDANKYFPIRFFEKWMRYVTDEDNLADTQRGTQAGIDKTSPNYHYRMRYPDGNNGYRVDGVQVIKFERDHKTSLTYTFVKAFPIAINSMPVSYDSSNLLKCNVSMSYIRYFIGDTAGAANDQPTVSTNPQRPDTQPSSNLPEPLKNSSEVIQNTGPEGEGLSDSATKAPLTTIDQVLQGGPGDQVSQSLLNQLGT